MHSLLKYISRQVSSEKSDIPEGGEGQMAAKVYLDMSSFSRSARSRNIWKTETDLPAVQSFQTHVARFVSQYHRDMDLFEKSRHIYYILWSEKWLFKLGSFNTNVLFAQDCLTYWVFVEPSTIKQEQAKVKMLCIKISAKVKQWVTSMTRGSIVNLRYRGAKAFLEKDARPLRSMNFKTGSFVCVKWQNTLMARSSKFVWNQLNSIAWASSTIRALYQIKIMMPRMLWLEVDLSSWCLKKYILRKAIIQGVKQLNICKEKQYERQKAVYRLWCRLLFWIKTIRVLFFVIRDGMNKFNDLQIAFLSLSFWFCFFFFTMLWFH